MDVFNSFVDFILQYVLPVVAPLVGVLAGIFVFHFKENVRIQSERMDALNKWVINADGALNSLLKIKDMYRDKLSRCPNQRAPAIGVFNIDARKIDVSDLSALYFLVPNEPVGEDNWIDIQRIRSMFEGYNTTLDHWVARHQSVAPMFQAVYQSSEMRQDIEIDDLVKMFGKNSVFQAFDYCELAIANTDLMIFELLSFLENVASQAKPLVDRGTLKSYGHLIAYKDRSKELESLIRPTELPSLDLMVKLSGGAVSVR